MQKPGSYFVVGIEGQGNVYVSVLLFRNDQHTFLTTFAVDLFLIGRKTTKLQNSVHLLKLCLCRIMQIMQTLNFHSYRVV